MTKEDSGNSYSMTDDEYARISKCNAKEKKPHLLSPKTMLKF